jgi:hypothetical protein
MYPSNCIFALILHMRIIDRTRLKLRFLILQVARSLTRCLPSCMFASDQRHPNLVVVVSLWMATWWFAGEAGGWCSIPERGDDFIYVCTLCTDHGIDLSNVQSSTGLPGDVSLYVYLTYRVLVTHDNWGQQYKLRVMASGTSICKQSCTESCYAKFHHPLLKSKIQLNCDTNKYERYTDNISRQLIYVVTVAVQTTPAGRSRRARTCASSRRDLTRCDAAAAAGLGGRDGEKGWRSGVFRLLMGRQRQHLATAAPRPSHHSPAQPPLPRPNCRRSRSEQPRRRRLGILRNCSSLGWEYDENEIFCC